MTHDNPDFDEATVISDDTALFEENDELVSQIKSSQTLDFELDFLESIGSIAENRLYVQGETILREGEQNTYLFFLMRGCVGVYVDGERVSQMETRGDLIGEMSVISKKPVSATIRAESEVEVIGIPTDKLDELDPEAAKNFSHTMNRIYANILTEKLVSTNEKAKQFEVANRELLAAQKRLEDMNNELEMRVQSRTQDLLRKTEELKLSNLQLESQNTLLQTSFRKLEEFAGSKRVTFSKLTALFHNTLVPLGHTIEELKQRLPAPPPVPAPNAKPGSTLHTVLERAAEETKSVMGILEPMTVLFSQEKALNSKRVLFLDSDRKHQLVARLALGGTGVQLDLANDINEARMMMSSKDYDILFVDSKLAPAAGQLQSVHSNAHMVLMTSATTELPLVEDRSLFKTIISRDENDRTFTIKSIMTTAQKLINQDIFGLEKYMAWGVDVRSLPVERSDQRDELLTQMSDYFKGMGIRKSLIERCVTVGEELLMNAIYDAPVDEAGKALYNHLSRRDQVVLRDRERGTFQFGCDGMLAAISVIDPFGGLKPETLFRYLQSCYTGQSLNDTVERHKGGAGRGLHQIVENSDLVIFNVRPKSCTEAIALFNLDLTKGEQSREPSFHFFAES